MNYTRHIREFLDDTPYILRNAGYSVLALLGKLIQIVKTSSQVLSRLSRKDAGLMASYSAERTRAKTVNNCPGDRLGLSSQEKTPIDGFL